MKIRTLNLRQALTCILPPALVAVIGTVLVQTGLASYSALKKPPLSPPGWLFGIVWTILYILMAVSCCLVRFSNCTGRQSAMQIYYIQLALNLIWIMLFFRFGLLLPSAIVLALLTVSVIFMIMRFSECDLVAAQIQLPYMLWCFFASYLNIAIAVLN